MTSRRRRSVIGSNRGDQNEVDIRRAYVGTFEAILSREERKIARRLMRGRFASFENSSPLQDPVAVAP